MTNRTKITIIFLVMLAFVCAIALQVVAASSDNKSLLPMVFYEYQQTPTPTTAPPPPTATPTPVIDPNGQNCAYIWASRDKLTGGMHISAQAPGLCSILVVDHYEDVGNDELVVVRAELLETGTWGCQEGDFGMWPPVEYECPMPIPPEIFPPDQWGFYKTVDIDKNTKYVCGLCPSFPRPYTCNCVETTK